MSSDSNASSVATEPARGEAPLPASRRKLSRSNVKLALVVLVVASWIGSSLLAFSFPSFSDRLVSIYFIWLLALFVLFIGDLVRRRWKQLAIFLAIWAFVLLPFYVHTSPFRWFYVEALRIHTSPLEEYLSRCKLIEFVENGANQKVGVCERHGQWGDVTRTLLYDTTGELASPLSQRTPEWTKAMVRFSPGLYFTETEGHAHHLLGHFYEVDVPPEEADGAADDY